ncbi:MAG: Hsp33 family molecular chaperone HslO [Lactovum sp.]
MDKIIKSISANGHFRAFALDSQQTVTDAQNSQQTLASSSVALGRTIMVAQILAALEKNDTKITVKVIADGPMSAILAVADTQGAVKAYVKNPDLDYRKTSTGEILVGPLIGNGDFIVIKDMGLRTSYTGKVELISAEIAEDLAWYFLKSEQTPSSVGVNIQLNKDDSIKSATAFLLQALPGASEEEILQMEEQIKKMPALSQLTIDNILPAIYGDIDYKILESSDLKFHCDCSRERFKEGLKSIGNKELTAMIEEDHGAEIICQFCQKNYQFDEKDLNQLILEERNDD